MLEAGSSIGTDDMDDLVRPVEHQPRNRTKPQAGRDGIGGLDAPCRCPNCGTVVDPLESVSIKRGAVTITGRPREVRWRGIPVGLSPLQSEIFAVVAMRGRASFEAIDEAMARLGASIGTRSIHILRIRQKFAAVGAKDPFQRIGNSGFRLVVEADEQQSTSTVIGVRAH